LGTARGKEGRNCHAKGRKEKRGYGGFVDGMKRSASIFLIAGLTKERGKGAILFFRDVGGGKRGSRSTRTGGRGSYRL